MTREDLPALFLVCAFLFGCVFVGAGASGLWRGKFWYRREWLTPAGDGLFFWMITSSAIVVGAFVALTVVWLAFEWRIIPPG